MDDVNAKKTRTEEAAALAAALEAVLATPEFAGSPKQAQLLTYLVERSAAGDAPKEFDIAQDVFERGADFDPASNSFIRVQIHGLRKRLADAYANGADAAAGEITIPKGGYGVVLQPPASEQNDGTTAAAPRGAAGFAMIAGWALAGLALILLAVSWAGRPGAAPAATPLLAEVISPNAPTLIVVGDLYVYRDSHYLSGEGTAFINHTHINSDDDLRRAEESFGIAAGEWRIIDRRYLPPSAMFLLPQLTGEITAAGGSYEVMRASDTAPQDLRGRNIIYIGYFNSLRALAAAREGTAFPCLEHCRFLRDTRTDGRLQLRGKPSVEHTDIGYLALRDLEENGRALIFAGLSDAGVMHAARTGRERDALAALATETGLAAPEMAAEEALEVLFEVRGFRFADTGGKATAWSRFDGAPQSTAQDPGN